MKGGDQCRAVLDRPQGLAERRGPNFMIAVAGLEPRGIGRALRIDVADLDAGPRIVAHRQDAEEGVHVRGDGAEQFDALELLLLVAALHLHRHLIALVHRPEDVLKVE